MTEAKSNATADAKTILVVEDEELLRDMEHSILEGCGYRVLAAGSSGKALEVWNEEDGKIDLLLTDIVLPRGMSGLELAQQLFKRQPGLKVIFTTGRFLRDLDHQAFEKMNARFLQKPYQGEDLVQIVSEALEAP